MQNGRFESFENAQEQIRFHIELVLPNNHGNPSD